MFDKLKNLVTQIFTNGNQALDSISNKQEYKANPSIINGIQSRFEQYATAKPADYITEGANKVRQDYSYDPTNSRLAFKNPFQQEMRQLPNEQDPMIQRLNNTIASGIDWGKRIAGGAGNFTVDLLREIPRGSARIGLSLPNPDLPTSMTPKSKLEKLVYGDKQIDSYNLANRKFGQSRGLSSSQIDDTLPAFMAGGILLDNPITAGVDDLAKGGVKAIAKSEVLHTAQEAGEAILKGMSKTERLKHLMDYGKELLASGFSREAVDKISAAQAATILKNNITADRFTETVARELPIAQKLDSFKSAMRTWIGSRDASKIEAIIKAKEFQQLDEMGQEGFHMVQSGNFTKTFESLRNYFDSARQRLLDANIPVAYQDNYIPQLWKNTPEEIDIVMGRKLATGTKFSLQKIFKTYEEGIAGGLTPKFNSLKDLVGSYEQGIGKAIADKNFFSWLLENGVIKPASKAPQGWLSLSADHFPFAGKEVYKASSEIAGHINNYLSTPTGVIPSIAQFSNAIKNIVLSAGIPGIEKLGNVGSGFNTLGLMSVTKSTLSNPNPIKGFTRAMEYLINPNKATKYVEENLARMPDFVKHGGVISVEDWQFLKPYAEETNNIIKKTANTVINFNHKYFEDKIFNSILPALKLQTYDNILGDLTKHLPELEAKREAAKQVNNIFGGLNTSYLLRSKDTQNFLRAFAMAPDLLESNGRIAVGMAKALFNPSNPIGKEYRLFARNFLLHRASTELLNKLASGHWQFRNEGVTNKVGYIETNYYLPNGKRMDFKIPGIDSLRLPVEFALHLANQDINSAIHMVQNRLSAPVAMGVAQLTNRDYRNKEIANSDDTLPKQMFDRSVAAGSSFLPSYVKAPINMALGKQGALETAAQMIEAPVAFRGGPTSKTSQATTEIMQQGGASGKEIHNQIEADKPFNKPKKLTEEQQLKNLQDGLPLNTERNIFGKAKTPAQTPSEATNTTETTGSASMLRNAAKADKDQADKKAIVKKIYETLQTDEQVSKALAANGISEREAMTMMAKDLSITTGQRGEFLTSIIHETKSREEMVKTIAELMKDDLITSGVISKWYEDGVIDEATKKDLTGLLNTINGKKTTSGGTGSKSLPASAKMTAPSLNVPALRLPPKVDTSAISKPIQVGKIREIGRIPTFEQLQQAINSTKRSGSKVQFSALPQAPK